MNGDERGHPSVSSLKPPKSYGTYSEKQQDDVIAFIKDGNSLRTAEKVFGIPKSTMHCWLKKRRLNLDMLSTVASDSESSITPIPSPRICDSKQESPPRQPTQIIIEEAELVRFLQTEEGVELISKAYSISKDHFHKLVAQARSQGMTKFKEDVDVSASYEDDQEGSDELSVSSLSHQGQQRHRGTYSKDECMEVVQFVKDGHSARAAAKRFGIPKSTVHNWLHEDLYTRPDRGHRRRNEPGKDMFRTPFISSPLNNSSSTHTAFKCGISPRSGTVIKTDLDVGNSAEPHCSDTLPGANVPVERGKAMHRHHTDSIIKAQPDSSSKAFNNIACTLSDDGVSLPMSTEAVASPSAGQLDPQTVIIAPTIRLPPFDSTKSGSVHPFAVSYDQSSKNSSLFYVQNSNNPSLAAQLLRSPRHGSDSSTSSDVHGSPHPPSPTFSRELSNATKILATIKKEAPDMSVNAPAQFNHGLPSSLLNCLSSNLSSQNLNEINRTQSEKELMALVGGEKVSADDLCVDFNELLALNSWIEHEEWYSDQYSQHFSTSPAISPNPPASSIRAHEFASAKDDTDSSDGLFMISKQDKEKVVRYLAEGHSIDEAERHFGIPKNTVHAWLAQAACIKNHFDKMTMADSLLSLRHVKRKVTSNLISESSSTLAPNSVGPVAELSRPPFKKTREESRADCESAFTRKKSSVSPNAASSPLQSGQISSSTSQNSLERALGIPIPQPSQKNIQRSSWS